MKTSLKIAFITLGCPKNLVDSEENIKSLRMMGYKLTDDYKKADLIIVNTCGFINDAIQESLEQIDDALKHNGKVIVTGCLGAKQEIILQKYPKVLEITGPNSTKDLISAVTKHLPLPEKTRHRTNILQLQDYKLTPAHYAYLKISEGCNQNCSYCIIPNLRGKLVSKPFKEIMQEAEDLVNNGVKELIIVSQDTGAYGTDLKNTNFLELVTALSDLGIWIRLHYLYPYPEIDKVLPLMAAEKIVPYLDVPLQHVNKRILQLMRRPANKENVLKRIQLWREVCPDVTIRSTFIVGFPGETDSEFQEMLDFLEESRLDRVGCFKYSAVEGAKANELPQPVSEKIKEKRFHEFMTLQQKISAEKLKNKIGKKIKVIIDDFEDNVAVGRSYADAPEIDGLVFIKDPKKKSIVIGDIVEVLVQDSDEYDLYAVSDTQFGNSLCL